MGKTTGDEWVMKMYKDWADVYDVIHAAQKQSDDIPFLLKLVKEYGGPVLECACGTGRMMIPLAKAGFEMHGIDTSSEMIAVLEKKMRTLPASVRKRISYERGDMRNFGFDKKFRTCIIAFNSLYHLQNDKDVMKCFRNVNIHLEKGGTFIIDIFDFDPNYEQGVFALQAEAKDSKGRVIRKYAKSIFGRNQVNDSWFRIVTDDHGKRKMLIRKFKLHYLHYEQAWEMLEAAGFRVMKVYSNYESEPYQRGSHNEKMIFVAKKVSKGLN